MQLELTINGKKRSVDAPPHRRLLDVLRYDLGLTGTKEGCGEGECGACTVLVDGAAANSCLIAAAQASGRSITTIEGLAKGAVLTAVQRALVEEGGTQCGICTPGIALAATVALRKEPGANRERVREMLAGNLCRCTGYQRIIDAVAEAAARSSR
jgi:aerobic carbon-monoxide dehydrogenase small subunit